MSVSKAEIILIVISFSAFGICNGFYRPMPIFLRSTNEKIMKDRLVSRHKPPSPAQDIESPFLVVSNNNSYENCDWGDVLHKKHKISKWEMS